MTVTVKVKRGCGVLGFYLNNFFLLKHKLVLNYCHSADVIILIYWEKMLSVDFSVTLSRSNFEVFSLNFWCVTKIENHVDNS